MKKTTLILALILLLGLPAMAQQQEQQQQEQQQQEQQQQQQPYRQADDTWISISGTVEAVSLDEFTLSYGDSTITVETDDWDTNIYRLTIGDTVTVSGMIDDDFFENTTIEASSVYVKSQDTYFYASPIDEEDQANPFITITPPVVASTTVQGLVTEVDDEEFTINTGLRELTVEVEEMSYNPLDNEGFQRIQVGDRVSVNGEMDYDLFEGRELVASSIIKLSEVRSRSRSEIRSQ